MMQQSSRNGAAATRILRGRHHRANESLELSSVLEAVLVRQENPMLDACAMGSQIPVCQRGNQ